jgi:hypothetical protein
LFLHSIEILCLNWYEFTKWYVGEDIKL